MTGTHPIVAALRVLALDDDPMLLTALGRILKEHGIALEALTDPAKAMARLEADADSFDLMLCDVNMPLMNGLDVLERVVAAWPELPVVMMTSDDSARTAVRALKAGAYDYLAKDFSEPASVVHVLGRAAAHRRLTARARTLEHEVAVAHRFESMVGKSPALRAVFEVIGRVAATDVTVLVRGESGTGKELVARAIHERSPRAARPFVALNCGALPEGLIDSELFGHVRGAFSGAVGERHGVFEEANHGTLLLDEVGNLPAATQVRLLRVLQEGEVRPVGSTVTRKVDVRVIAATHVNLEAAVADKRFREDLFYRLNVVSLELPPLRQRLDDVPLLARHFLDKHAARQRRPAPRLTPALVDILAGYGWPGNVRELENALEGALALSPADTLDIAHLPRALRQATLAAATTVSANPVISASPGAYPDELLGQPYNEARARAQREFEKTYLERLLGRAAGNISEAARLAGLDRSNFRRLMARHQDGKARED